MLLPTVVSATIQRAHHTRRRRYKRLSTPVPAASVSTLPAAPSAGGITSTTSAARVSGDLRIDRVRVGLVRQVQRVDLGSVRIRDDPDSAYFVTLRHFK